MGAFDAETSALGQRQAGPERRKESAYTGAVWPFRRERGREPFRSHELAVIDALREALPAEAVELYDRQIEAVEIVQPLFDDTDVSTYPNRSGPQYHDPAHDFANKTPDLKLATLSLRGAAGTGR